MTLARRVAALERRATQRPLIVEPAAPHPLPDLTGATTEAILEAVFSAMADAHPESASPTDEPEAGAKDKVCPRCVETFQAGERLAERPGQLLGNPLRRFLDNELAWLDEMKRWSVRPGVRFDRAAWDADQERQEREHYFTNHYRGVTPPWVVLDDAESGSN